jgi:hypothetical protein
VDRCSSQSLWFSITNFVDNVPKWCNPSLALVTKARACKVVGQERKPRNEKKCEGMNPHTPKGAFTLGVGVPVDSQILRKRSQGSKPNGLKRSLYYWKAIEM